MEGWYDDTANSYVLIYPYNFEQKTGFDQIRRLLSMHCMSDPARDLVAEIHFTDDMDDIRVALDQAMEMRRILLFSEPFPAQDYFDMRDGLRLLAVKGAFLEPAVLVELRASLHSIAGICHFLLGERQGEYPELATLAAEVSIDPEIIASLDRLLDERGIVRDDASPELARLRRERFRLQARVEQEISAIMTQARRSGWVADDAEMTIRNGRLVLPVLAASKRQLKGLIHDRSATGHTLYIEPQEIFEANNEIRELELAEEEEIRRILTALADTLRPMLPEIRAAYDFLARMDLIRAKARLALQLKADKPLLNDKPIIEWFDAVHPLLYLSHQAQKKSVVPLRIKLDDGERILVISGPNAGGKSVALKTVVLLQYMLQCGLLVPMRATSETGIFNKLLLDIGDEQSLENDLSTYSSHLLNMQVFLRESDAGTLFLIDEFGAGTEPRFGGALAEAILEKLHTKGAFGVVTTHYANLKMMGGQRDGIINGAMQFDVTNMSPLFALETGKPGSSFAFEIASRIGLGQDVLDAAVQKAGQDLIDLDRQLQQLENDRRAMDKKQTELRVADAFLSEMIDKYENQTRDLEKRRQEILAEARKQARTLIEDSNRLIETTIREIKEASASREATRALRQKLEEQAAALVSEPQPPEVIIKKEKEDIIEKPPPAARKTSKVSLPKELTTGDKVQVVGQQTIGEIISIQGKMAEVAFASMKMRLPVSQLQRPDAKEMKEQARSKPRSERRIIDEINEKMANFNAQIDLRGMRAEECLYTLRHYIDDAILLNINTIRILHGKGDGILRQVVREFVSHIPEVRQYHDEHIEMGGHGITVVHFR
ncbi:MAG: Smr/MutS family protein [Lentimicrobiaceae bacterium]|nr:Smr/MutS family protein [Lentimicrobiaceae bacterium]